jgi:hypothetical protein
MPINKKDLFDRKYLSKYTAISGSCPDIAVIMSHQHFYE